MWGQTFADGVAHSHSSHSYRQEEHPDLALRERPVFPCLSCQQVHRQLRDTKTSLASSTLVSSSHALLRESSQLPRSTDVLGRSSQTSKHKVKRSIGQSRNGRTYTDFCSKLYTVERKKMSHCSNPESHVVLCSQRSLTHPLCKLRSNNERACRWPYEIEGALSTLWQIFRSPAACSHADGL